jgi:hypothetical protein
MKRLSRKWGAGFCWLTGLLLASASPALAQAGAAIIQTRFTADPAPLVHDGVVYLYTSHDEDGGMAGHAR